MKKLGKKVISVCLSAVLAGALLTATAFATGSLSPKDQDTDQDSNISEYADSTADATTCTGVPVAVVFSTNRDEKCTFSCDDGAEIIATYTGKHINYSSFNGHSIMEAEIYYNLTITEIGLHEITCVGDDSGNKAVMTIDVEPHDLKYYEEVEPTCTEEGHEEYYQCTVCEKMFADADATKSITASSVILPALGHTWSDPEWTWSEDYNEASATWVCKVCDTAETKDAEVTSETTATCTEPGETTYTASVSLDGNEYSDTQIVETEALGHDWGDVEWTWSEDHSSATASWTCKNCGLTETLDAMVTSETTDPTETEDGLIVYTATVTVEDGSELTTTYDEVIPATGEENPDSSTGDDGDDGSSDDGSSEDGSSEDGSSEDGSSEDGSSEDGSSEEETTDSGTTDSGTTDSGSSSSGYSSNGTSGNSGSSGNSGTSGSSGTSTYSPQTDDPTNLTALWIVLAGFGLAGCAALVLYKVRRPEHN